MTTETVRMLELAQKGFYCSQILLFLGLEAQGKSDPDLIRAMSGLAGGWGFPEMSAGRSRAGPVLWAYTPEEAPRKRRRTQSSIS